MNAIQKLSLKLVAGERPAPPETKLFDQRPNQPRRPAAARIPTRRSPRPQGR